MTAAMRLSPVAVDPLSTYRPFEEYSDSGAIGDPKLASAEKGEELLDRLADELADVFRNVSEQAR